MKKEEKSVDIHEIIRNFLIFLGEDPEREGLLKTPERVKKAYYYLTSGYRTDVKEVVNGAIFHEDSEGIVLVKDIKFFSLCEHHLIPFFGDCHVAYIPDGKIIGLSKVARIVDMFAKRLQVQERLTKQIAETIEEVVQPKGVAVVMEATHLCMVMRGVEKYNSLTTTSYKTGVFKENPDLWSEFISLIKK